MSGSSTAQRVVALIATLVTLSLGNLMLVHAQDDSALAAYFKAQVDQESMEKSQLGLEDIIDIRDRNLHSRAPPGCKYNLRSLARYELDWRVNLESYWQHLPSLTSSASKLHDDDFATQRSPERVSNITRYWFYKNRLPKPWFAKTCKTNWRKLAINFYIHDFPKGKKRWLAGCTGQHDGVEHAILNVFDCNGNKILCDGYGKNFVLKNVTDIVISLIPFSSRVPLDFEFWFSKKKPSRLFCDFYPGADTRR